MIGREPQLFAPERRDAVVRDSSMRSVAMLLVTLSLLAAGCSSGPNRASGSVSADEPAPPTPPELEPTVNAPGSGELPTTVLCDGIPLSVTDLSDVALVSERPIPVDAMAPLDEFLATGEGDFWPQDGYWVINTSEDHYLLVHHDPNGTMTMLGTQRSPNSAGWVASTIQSGRPCELRSALPDGFGIVAWRVDPDWDAPPDVSHIDLLASGQACSGGQPMGDRLMPPQVTETDDAILVALMAKLPEGDQTCPGNPEEPVRVELGEPIGTREVRDALRSGQTLADFVPVSP